MLFTIIGKLIIWYSIWKKLPELYIYLYIYIFFYMYLFFVIIYQFIFIISVIQVSKNPARNFEKIKLLFIFILTSLYTRHKPPLRIQISRKISKSLFSNVNFWIPRNFATIAQSSCIIYIYHDSIQIIRYFYINSETTLSLHAFSFWKIHNL